MSADTGGISDTTGRTAADEALRRSEARFRQVLEATPNALVMINRAGLIEMVNGQAERMFGHSRAELLGQPVEMLVPERFRAVHPGHRAGFYADPRSRPMGTGRDLFGLRKDGSEFPVEIGLSPIETGDAMMVLSAVVDISVRKRLEERFRLVVEATPNALVMVNRAGLIEMVNAQAEHMFGYSRTELLGQPVEMLLPEPLRANHPRLRGSFYADARSRPMGAGRDLNAVRKDGVEFPVEIGLNPIETDEGTMVLAGVVDISDRKREEERLRAALKEKEILLGEIHHRVKNNLQIVHSLLDLQSASISDPAAVEMLRDGQNRIRSMALIHQLLYFSKDFARVDFATFLDNLIPTLVSSYAIESDRFTISINAADGQLPLNAAVPCGLIANELISNAFKHAFPGGRLGEIRIELTRDGTDQAVLLVSDDGIGIPDDLVLESTSTFGLQLVMLLADQLGGELEIHRSTPTRFLLRFPMQR
jgi:PAS domain S-box-containing protein